MTFLLVRHKVEDFARWKQVFDQHAEAQREGGLVVKDVLHNVEDPSELFLWFEVTDIEKARSFMSAPAAKDAKETSGVLDDPDIYFLR